MSDRSRLLEISLFLLILVIGAALRLAALDSAPPGLTYEEASRSLEAAHLLDEGQLISLTPTETRTPLFDYANAAVMLAVGRTLLSSRLTAVLGGISLLILTYLWVRVATSNRWLALATMALMAVGFWAVFTSRQAPRAETLPALFMAAALAMRRGIVVEEDPQPYGKRPAAEIDRYTWFVVAGVLIGLSIYTHIAARLMWLVFPLFFIFLSLTQPGVIRKVWPGLVVTLIIAFVVALPVIVHYLQDPPRDLHIETLDGMREDLRTALRMITIRGDAEWLYNLPGRPLLGPISALLFYLGLSIALVSIFFPYRPVRQGLRTYDDAFRISSANVFMLLTLVIGIFPAVLTGTGASIYMTGIQPALYYMPALAAVWLADWAFRHVGGSGARAIWVAYSVLIAVIGVMTAVAYFGRWNSAPEVRAAYHTETVELLRYLDDHPELGPDIAISTTNPEPLGDPAIARMVLKRDDLAIRWFDGGSALVIPQHDTDFFEIGDANLAAELKPFQANHGSIDSMAIINQLGGVLGFLGSHISLEESLKVITYWRIMEPLESPLELVVSAVDSDGSIVVQNQHAIDGSGLLVGDRIIVIHFLNIPANSTNLEFFAMVGESRIPLLGMVEVAP